MKNIIVSGLLLGCIGLMACKKDNIENRKALILGKWNFVKYSQTRLKDGEVTLIDIPDYSYMNFLDNGNVNVHQDNDDIKYTWELFDKGKGIGIKGAIPEKYIIKELDAQNFNFYSDVEVNGEMIRYSIYLSKPYLAP